MPEKLTYAKTGVNRKLRAKAKTALETLQQTYKYSPYGKILQLPYGNLIPTNNKYYLDLTIEGVGTKVLLAQLANKHDTIGIDAVAMAVNDTMRSGARPLAIADNIHTQQSNPTLTKQLLKGITHAAKQSQCPVISGEIGDVPEIIKGLPPTTAYDIIISCIGTVHKNNIIHGNNIEPKDTIIGLRSSGLHSNGITLARKTLFKQWGGKYNPHDIPQGLDKELIHETLKPTKIYVKPLQEVTKKHRIKAAVHITGDAYLKLNKLTNPPKKTGFQINNLKPQPIFNLIQKTAKPKGGITDQEMLKTFNMGWGFALIADKREQDNILDTLEKTGTEAEPIGEATQTGEVVAVYKGRKLVLT